MSNIPKLRFPEFTDAWEKCKLGSIAKRVKGNDGDMSLPTLTISAGSGWLSQKERFSGNIAGTEQKNYTLLKKGQLSYNHGNSKLAKYGAVFVLKTYEKALVPRVYHSFEINKNGCADFIEVLFATKLPDRELVKKITSGARIDGLLNISFEGFMDINIKIPDLPEQQKIGNLFKQLDRLITLHKRKWDDVILLKKALLQKMFPKNGSDFPEIRFPEFTDAWEKCKLGEVAKQAYGGGTPSTLIKEFWNGSIAWIQSSDLKIDEIFPVIAKKFISKTALEKSATKLIPANSIAIVTRVGVGKLAVMSDKYTTSQDFISLSNIQGDTFFIAYSLYSILKKESNQAQGTSIKGITKVELLNKTLYLPTLPEQQKIGNLFKQLDRLITLHKRQHEHYQLLKKALLQQMFV
ncbi:restriction endonuclease subunit S [Gallibacterium anatis]|uniref:restriction endonuclease subunit S n=1 Tax=Gallibacterium anatis TaxID=750 RepID=UPI0030C940FA